MARTRYGKTFRTRRGRYGRYKYVNGRRVAFEPLSKSRYSKKRGINRIFRYRKNYRRY